MLGADDDTSVKSPSTVAPPPPPALSSSPATNDDPSHFSTCPVVIPEVSTSDNAPIDDAPIRVSALASALASV